MSVFAPDGRPLVGRYVRLDRAVLADAPALFRALDDDRVYAGNFMGGPSARPNTVETMGAVLGAMLSTAGRTPYTVRLTGAGDLGPAGTIVGTTSLGNLSLTDERVHLGWTGYCSAVWGTQVNPECKLLLLEHLFTDCGLGRVQIQTDAVNNRSQAAIERLGAVREGVLRRHIQRADGTFRDTVVYSILKDEWPGVKTGLVERLA
ncbi:Protein N-acetyltransferase, RimJ/RimL family [Nakamurella panacisegetis]|uniref:Protein N-acetyltransferase, RimJ/RimL family n=1 Tax=Nakamurella panacisegetis TaxID=1090615 RepID=A0A1H0PKV3_9ACTN|nr:GNAT family protein [Nakamurella panacisegetis]SDP05410.1 Protein N-acetyltransferase, RimJ/RimL family [Nakamurella panacisegetis]